MTAARGGAVLVIDDAEDCREALEMLLDGLPNVTVHAVRSAEEGLAVLERVPVAAIITDVRLPRMDGLELIARLRGDGYAHTPIVVISGETDPDAAEKALRAGANAFYSKPFSASAVRRKIEEFMHAN